MTAIEHRAHSSFAIATHWAALLSVAIGVVTCAAIALSIFPDAQGLAVGVGYGLIPGVLAAAGVLVARRALLHETPFWRTVAFVVLSVSAATALLFALTQLAIEMALLGAILGAWTALFATLIALMRSRR